LKAIPPRRIVTPTTEGISRRKDNAMRKYMSLLGVAAVLWGALTLAAPLKPIAVPGIEGSIKSVSWSAEKTVKAIPGMSGSAGVDRTFPARYTVTLTKTTITANPATDSCPYKSGEEITVTLNHDKDDGYLKLGMTVKISDYTMQGDEGGFRTTFSKIQILKEKPD
jgi:hypothetical protein